MLFLHKEFVNSGTVYPMDMGSFVAYLQRQYNWTIVKQQTDGPRSLDRWLLASPAGEVFEIISWLDGGSVVKTEGGITVLTDSQMSLNLATTSLMEVSEDDRKTLRRRVEDALRKNPAFAGSVLRLALATKAIKGA